MSRVGPHAELQLASEKAVAPKLSGPMNFASRVSSAKERPTSILGPDILIYGKQLVLKTKGSLLIQGHIEANVHGESVTVDDGAYVKGVITAHTIAIQGSVEGELKGSIITLHERAAVDAKIVHHKLTVTEGAQFEGSAKKAKDIAEVTPDLS